jgi:tryptophan synthase beta chain
MKLYGAEVHASPSSVTETVRSLLERDPKHPGSLGIAISEGLEYIQATEGYIYSLGSVLNHVLVHQTIIGQETMEQFDLVDEQPDVLIGCFGGGSNFRGFSLRFVGEVLAGKRECEFLASQSKAAANIAEGDYRYDFADHAGMTTLLKMYTLGHDADMQPIKAEGLTLWSRTRHELAQTSRTHPGKNPSQG